MSIFNKNMKINQYSLILYLFIIPLFTLSFYVLLGYILTVYVPANLRPSNLGNLFSFIYYLILFIFDIVIFCYLIIYPTEYRIFFKFFLILTLIFTTYSNYNYAISKQFNIDIKNLIERGYSGYVLYYGSLSYFYKLSEILFDQTHFTYVIGIPYYTSYGVIIGYYFDSIAFICGLPYYLIHLILPSFLSLTWFFIWLISVIALIFMPYYKLINLRNRLINYLKKKKSENKN